MNKYLYNIGRSKPALGPAELTSNLRAESMHEGTGTYRISTHAFLPCGDVAKAALVLSTSYTPTRHDTIPNTSDKLQALSCSWETR
jgi:hypothetical protein